MQNYDDGIVIESRGEYFAVFGAEACDGSHIRGYVESTYETIDLPIGRDGREAEVVKVTDRETYADDQRAYRDEVAKSKVDHKQAVKDYPQDLRVWKTALAAATQKQKEAAAELNRLELLWLTALGCTGTAVTAPATAPAPAPAQPARREGVDPDCYGDGTICNKARLADAEALDELVGPLIAKSGWNCHQVRYVADDDGGKVAISIEVPLNCVTGPEVPEKSHLTKLAKAVRRVVAGKAVALNVDLLQVTDGDGIDVQVPVTASKK